MAQLLEYIKMAFFNIVTNKMRSALTMLGIIIGISSVILIMSLGNGAKKMISGELDSVGNGQVALMSLTDEMISLADLDAVVEQVDGIVAYRDDPTSQGTISTVKGEFSANVTGCRVDQNLFEQYTELTKGRYFNDQEFENGTHVCYMGASDAIRMFGTTDVLGMSLEVEFVGRGLGEYMVIGITDYKDSNSMMNFTYEDMPVSIYVPTTTL
ncbi:MAG: ABC transporter permease, partial [Lachnospiraceae bacterium]|nr:ABC transporter permease [Lachnospiraceae bacterium]